MPIEHALKGHLLVAVATVRTGSCPPITEQPHGTRTSREKARTHPLRLAGLVANRTTERDLINEYTKNCPVPVLETFSPLEQLRVSRVEGKTLFEKAEEDFSCFEFVESYLNLADQLLVQPEGVVAHELNDRELFQTLSNLYLGNSNEDNTNALDFMMV